MECVSQHCDLVKSAEDPNTYLINDTADPLQQSLSGLLLDGLPPSASAAFAPRIGCFWPVIRRYYSGNLYNMYLYAVGSSRVAMVFDAGIRQHPCTSCIVHLAVGNLLGMLRHVRVHMLAHAHNLYNMSVRFVAVWARARVVAPWLHWCRTSCTPDISSVINGWYLRSLGWTLSPLLGVKVLSCKLFPKEPTQRKGPEVAHGCAVASEVEGGNVVSQMWEGVARMTARARESTQSFLESSVLCTPPTAGGAFPSPSPRPAPCP